MTDDQKNGSNSREPGEQPAGSLNIALKDAILEKISTGTTRMIPAWHFILKAALMALGGMLVLLALLYLVSFIFFVLRQNGILYVPAFGLRGWYIFLVSLPGKLIFLSLIFIVILEILVRRYAFAYRRPLLFSVLGIMVLALFGGFAVERTHVHRQFFLYSQQGSMPFAGRMYREFGLQRYENVYPGVIIESVPFGFKMEDRQGTTLTVVVTGETRMPRGEELDKGNIVVVLGDRDDDTITAFGIRRIDDEVRNSFRGRMRMRMTPMMPPPFTPIP